MNYPQWQPIRTAPNDRRVILAHDRRVWVGALNCTVEHPTHWMELPPVPTKKGSKGESNGK